MFTIFANLRNTQKALTSPKMSRSARMLILGMMIVIAVAITIGFVWIWTAQVIAPPGLRIMNWLSGAFI